MPDEQFKVTWVDAGREPSQMPNPEFPDGIDIVGADLEKRHCKVELPYPANRCGYYRIECRVCGVRIGVTTAGRYDDPRSATFNCKLPTPAPDPKPKKAH
jgi:hypothetical protein